MSRCHAEAVQIPYSVVRMELAPAAAFADMYVIKHKQHNDTLWLESAHPEAWGGLDNALRFTTRNEAHRAAIAAGVSGDWSIDVYLEPASRLR